ncbi:uncharacterized protein LOC132560423 [Ylistrum balloti]|uniref:uncharacterized protein LOC132560423 n=1 Tax=Ylistrum balloti TaxID=509963 RepID=UPI002905B4E6|nr:uncharacterized protein LOC132560423 [Ylistrum balloti]
MSVHLFGASSSPGCANFALKQMASDNEEEFGSDIANFIKRDFYVDDGLKSLQTIDMAVDMIKGSKDMCGKGGLRLHKFLSSSKEVLKHIPEEDRAKGLEDIDVVHDKLLLNELLAYSGV